MQEFLNKKMVLLGEIAWYRSYRYRYPVILGVREDDFDLIGEIWQAMPPPPIRLPSPPAAPYFKPYRKEPGLPHFLLPPPLSERLSRASRSF